MKIYNWVGKLLERSGESKSVVKNPWDVIPVKCKCCKERFVTEKALLKHYAKVHPGLDRTHILKEEKRTQID